MGGLAQSDAHDRAADIQYEQAKNQEKIFAEQERRQSIRDQQVLGANTAAANASGFQVSGSTVGQYLADMKNEQDQEMKFFKDQAATTIELMHQSAANTRQGGDAALFTGVLQGAGSALNNFGSMSKTFGWFQSNGQSESGVTSGEEAGGSFG